METNQKAKAAVYLDLDHTLLDIEALKAPIREDMAALVHSAVEVELTAQELYRSGSYSFERHLEELGVAQELAARKVREYRERFRRDGNSRLFPGVVEGLRALASFAHCTLVTMGNPGYQVGKYEALDAIHPFIRDAHFPNADQSKGVIIARYPVIQPTFFLDNDPRHLMDVYALGNGVRVVRICWPNVPNDAHAGDGTLWPVVASFDAFVAMVRRAAGLDVGAAP